MDCLVKRKKDFPSVLKSDLLSNFAKELNAKLFLYYPDALCSTAFVSDQFNIRSNYEDRITRETARRWMKGEMMPEYTTIYTLRAWLGIDLNALMHFDPILKTEISIEPPEMLSQDEIQKQISRAIEAFDRIQREIKIQKASLTQIQLANILS